MSREEINREEMNREEMNRWAKQSGLLLVGLLVFGAGFLNFQFGQRFLQFLLPVSETAQVDYLGRILHWFEYAFLVLLLDPLLLLQVGLIYCDLRVSVLDLVQDRGEQLLQLFDLLRVPSQTHIAETIHFGLLLGGQVKVHDVVAQVDAEVAEEDVESLQELVYRSNLAVSSVLVVVAGRLLEVDRGYQPTRLKSVSLRLKIDGLLKVFNSFIVVLVNTVQVCHSEETPPYAVHHLLHIATALSVPYLLQLVFVYPLGHLEVDDDNFLVVGVFFLCARRLMGPIALDDLWLVVGECFFFFILIVFHFGVIAFIELLRDVFDEVVFGVVGIVGEGLLVEDLEVVFHFFEDEVGVFEVELGHAVGVLPELVLGLDHKVVEILINFIRGRLLDDSQVRFQVLCCLLHCCQINLNYQKTATISLWLISIN